MLAATGPSSPLVAAAARAGVVSWGGVLDRGRAGVAGGGVAARWCLLRAPRRRPPLAASSGGGAAASSRWPAKKGLGGGSPGRRRWRQWLHVDGGEDSTGTVVGVAPVAAMARVSRSRSGPVGPDLDSSDPDALCRVTTATATLQRGGGASRA